MNVLKQIYPKMNINILRLFNTNIPKLHQELKDRTILTRLCSRQQISTRVKNVCTERKAPWSVLFFGSDDFALQSLRQLYHKYEAGKLLSRLEIVTAYGGKENTVTKYARQHRIPIHNWPPDINLSEFHIGLVVSFGHLIPSRIILSFPLGMLNVHGSLLPRWRGAAPIIYALLNGDSETGISIMKVMPKKFDIGEVVAQQKLNVHPDETMPELRDRMSRLGADLLIDTLKRLPDILDHAEPQSNEGITYAPKVTPKLSLVKWNEMTAKNVYDLQRALCELYPLTTTFLGATLKLLDVQVLKDPLPGQQVSDIVPGLLTFNKELNKLVVYCRGNTKISVSNIGCPGRPPMSARDFYNGFLSKNKRKPYLFSS
ncbi:methionyl-tRNA formyltransferase, mitochondrial isoform X1 [Neodiprion virginianus]|uniref:methionyl-tRNA formyltransferase, mitochondrial isoform X1 n=1 Tax=Neodiprion fabricii TaxID=2872261 RepID=UPI001ED97760|nr:methionyl-tRNA formyltransferase, mitochondrial isoform X1 [Neodiprion fabricii]XP_046610283.1 methionyl-tRNA formyltransferase, mitochondrial isoform X1 [Neodiprion virginianus]